MKHALLMATLVPACLLACVYGCSEESTSAQVVDLNSADAQQGGAGGSMNASDSGGVDPVPPPCMPQARRMPLALELGVTDLQSLQRAVQHVAFMDDDLLVLYDDGTNTDDAAHRNLKLQQLNRDGEFVGEFFQIAERRTNGHALIEVSPTEVHIGHMLTNRNGDRVKFSSLARPLDGRGVEVTPHPANYRNQPVSSLKPALTVVDNTLYAAWIDFRMEPPRQGQNFARYTARYSTRRAEGNWAQDTIFSASEGELAGLSPGRSTVAENNAMGYSSRSDDLWYIGLVALPGRLDVGNPRQVSLGQDTTTPNNLSVLNRAGIKAVSWMIDTALKLAVETDGVLTPEDIAEDVVYAKLGGTTNEAYLVWAQTSDEGLVWSRRDLLTGQEEQSDALFSPGRLVASSAAHFNDDGNLEVATIHGVGNDGSVELWVTQLCRNPVEDEPGGGGGGGGEANDCSPPEVTDSINNRSDFEEVLHEITFDGQCIEEALGTDPSNQAEWIATFEACYTRYVQEALGLPEGCSSCFGAQAYCVMSLCGDAPCRQPGAACTQCRIERCGEAFEACAGIPAQF